MTEDEIEAVEKANAEAVQMLIALDEISRAGALNQFEQEMLAMAHYILVELPGRTKIEGHIARLIVHRLAEATGCK